MGRKTEQLTLDTYNYKMLTIQEFEENSEDSNDEDLYLEEIVEEDLYLEETQEQ